MKKHLLCLISLCICLLFTSCAAVKYRSDIPCSDIAKALSAEISGTESYARYGEDELSFMLEDSSVYDDCCFLYSRSSDDISEIAVLRSSSDTDALLLSINAYAATQIKEKRSFIENYLPAEFQKLEGCEARIFGEYVIFVMLNEVDKKVVFDEAERILKG